MYTVTRILRIVIVFPMGNQTVKRERAFTRGRSRVKRRRDNCNRQQKLKRIDEVFPSIRVILPIDTNFASPTTSSTSSTSTTSKSQKNLLDTIHIAVSDIERNSVTPRIEHQEATSTTTVTAAGNSGIHNNDGDGIHEKKALYGRSKMYSSTDSYIDEQLNVHYHDLTRVRTKLSVACDIEPNGHDDLESSCDTWKRIVRDGNQRDKNWSTLLTHIDRIKCFSPRPIHELYQIGGKQLGNGTYSTVVLGKSTETRNSVAIKIIDLRCFPKDAPSDSGVSTLENIKMEISILSECGAHALTSSDSTDYIVQMLNFYSTPSQIFIVLEYMEGGDLYEVVSKHGAMEEQKAITVIRQILRALAFLHVRRIIHRDVKLENIMLPRPYFALDPNGPTVKLSDFTFACHVDDTRLMKQQCGTPVYAAPEILSGENYGTGVDVWSSGVVLYVLITATMPFSGGECQKTMKSPHGYSLEYQLPMWARTKISIETDTLLSRMLCPISSGRINVYSALDTEAMRSKSDTRHFRTSPIIVTEIPNLKIENIPTNTKLHVDIVNVENGDTDDDTNSDSGISTGSSE